ncbi:MAG: NucA/NucB deoxyribonuclease domain-containing protein [Bryobacteraceae bacterium]
MSGALESVPETPIGTIDIVTVSYSFWSVSSRSWVIQQEFTVVGSTGADVGTPVTVIGQNACNSVSFCTTPTGAYITPVPEVPYADVETAAVTSPGTATTSGYIISASAFEILGTPTTPDYYTTSTIRCDSQPGNYSPSGCVNPLYIPLYILSSAQYPNVASTIRPYLNAHPNGDQLNRVSATQGAMNRNIACSGFVPDPTVPNGSCDEYPFATSAQGGAGAHTNTVPLSEHSSQGADLGVFYRTNRVIYGDEYDVEVN